jgi:opacity protein-like surface antigen
MLLPLALLCPLSAAAADAPKAEVFGSYSYAKSGEESLNGWNGALDVSVSRSFGVEASVSGHYGSELGTDISQQSLFLGPRFAWRGDRLTPFVHALGGVVRSSAGIDVFDVSISENDTDLGGAFGGGLDLGVGRNWAVRLQGDYVLRMAESDTEGDPRASVGLVYRAGRR